MVVFGGENKKSRHDLFTKHTIKRENNEKKLKEINGHHKRDVPSFRFSIHFRALCPDYHLYYKIT